MLSNTFGRDRLCRTLGGGGQLGELEGKMKHMLFGSYIICHQQHMEDINVGIIGFVYNEHDHRSNIRVIDYARISWISRKI